VTDLVRARLDAQLLSGRPASSPDAVAERILAVQAQDVRGFRLAVRSRSTGTTVGDLDAALADRRLVVGWLNRGTLHLVRVDDYWWLHGLTAPRQRVGNQRRLRNLGLDVPTSARGVDIVVDALTRDGPLTRAALRDRLEPAGVPTEGQALVHVLVAASVEGHVVRGPMAGSDQLFVAAEQWIGPAPASPDPDVALARLARRYLAGHGPAAPADLAGWAGLPLGDARRAFAAVAGETEVGADGLVALPGARAPAPLPLPRLLGPFDPLLHGWTSRDFVVGAHRGVVTVNGIFRPVALVDGRVVATWRMPGGVVTLDPLEAVAPRALDALAADAEAVLAYLGLPVRPLVVSDRRG
jgi:hypothetical protein